MNVQSPHKWRSTLKSAVFGSSSSLPPLVSEGGGLVCESVGKADNVRLTNRLSRRRTLQVRRRTPKHISWQNFSARKSS